MAKFINYKRIVIYQPRSGWVADLGPGRCLAPSYSPGESYFNTGAGTRKAISRNRQLVIPVFDEATIRHLRIMHMEGCEVRAICIGDAHSIIWELDSEINLVEFGGSFGGFSGVNLVLHNDVQWGSIYQSYDVLGGIPWECQTATSIGGTFYLPGPSGYQGNRYVGASGDSVDEDGAATVATSLVLEMYFPFEGATINLTGAWAGSVDLEDYSGSNLTSIVKSTEGLDSADDVPAGTWKMEVNVTSSSARPEIYVTAPGSLASPRPGGCIDCSDLSATLSTAPGWSS